MPEKARNEVFSVLEKMNISYRVIHHPAVFSIEEMQALQIADMDKVAKNLFVRDDKKRKYYLIVMRNNKSANLKELRHKIGSRPLSFASEDDLNRLLGLSKGKVTPFGILNDIENVVTVIIDEGLRCYDFIGVHPNDNTATVWISIEDLVKIFQEKQKETIFMEL